MLVEISISDCKPLLPLDSVVDSLRSSIPDVEWMLGEIESQHGWFRFPAFLANGIKNLKIQSYPLLYTNERAITGAFLKGFLDDAEILELGAELEAASLDERGEILQALSTSVGDAVDQIEIPKTLEEQEAARAKFLALSPDEQRGQFGLVSISTCFF